MSTKERILAAGLMLFNRDGVEVITTRHIAKELDMSQGNLHYHYPNKNEIISALLEHFFDDLNRAQRYEGGLFDRKEMLLSMQENFQIMYKYRLFFLEDQVIWRRLPEAKTRLSGYFEMTRSRIRQVIAGYESHKLFRVDVTSYQIEFLLDQFMFTITSWLHTASYSDYDNPSAQYAKHTFSIWLSYLIPEEARVWERMLS